MNYIIAKLVSSMLSKLVSLIVGILAKVLARIGVLLFKAVMIHKIAEMTFKALFSKIKALFPKAKDAVKRRFMIMLMDAFVKLSKVAGKTESMSELEKVDGIKDVNGVVVSEVNKKGEVIGEHVRVIKADVISQAVKDKLGNNEGYIIVEET